MLHTKKKHHLHDFYHKLQFRGKARDLLEDLSSSAPEKIYGTRRVKTAGTITSYVPRECSSPSMFSRRQDIKAAKISEIMI